VRARGARRDARQVELGDKDLTRPIGIIYRTGKHFSPAVEKFIEYLQADPPVTRGQPRTTVRKAAGERSR